MGRNLTSLPISASFQYLMQISGSGVTDGTGSLIESLNISASYATSASQADNATSASFATTASFALNVTPIDTGSLLTTASISDATITFTKADASTFDIEVNNVTNATSASYILGSNVNGPVTDAVNATSASHADNASTADSATTATSASHADNASTADSATSASYASVAADLTSDANISISTITASDASFTSASITNLTTITGSIVQVGDAFVLLNTATPTSRYAGLKVEDSGSTPTNYTASFYFDSQTNDWNYEYSGSDPTNFGVAMFGPEYGTKGSPSYPTNNRVLKGNGGHHVEDSTITDDGSTVSISASLNITGSGVDILSGSFSGSTVDNITDVYGTASVEHIVTLTQAQYDAISASADPNTYYIIEDAEADAGFPFTGSAGILGELVIDISGSDVAVTVESGSFTGSLIDNIVPTASIGNTQIAHIVNLTQDNYDNLGSYSDDTMYVISDTTGSFVSGSLRGNVEVLTISSATASMNCELGNFFTLELSGSVHLEATNIKKGQTISVRTTQGSPDTGSLSFSDSFKFKEGNAPTITSGTGSEDLLSFLSFDATNLYGAVINDFQ